jgi:hypothetical protein
MINIVHMVNKQRVAEFRQPFVYLFSDIFRKYIELQVANSMWMTRKSDLGML